MKIGEEGLKITSSLNAHTVLMDGILIFSSDASKMHLKGPKQPSSKEE